METIAQTKNWNDLPTLMQTHDLTNHDQKCLDEIQKVIEKHQLTSKFGVSLLHKHFDIASDEVLLESNDPVTRELVSRPIKIVEDMERKYATTQWRFDGGNKYGCAFCKRNHCDTEDMDNPK